MGCTRDHHGKIAETLVLPVYQTSNQPVSVWQNNYNAWLNSMWSHYLAHGCSFLENRITHWTTQLSTMTNVNSYAYLLKAAKVLWAQELWGYCDCHGPAPVAKLAMDLEEEEKLQRKYLDIADEEVLSLDRVKSFEGSEDLIYTNENGIFLLQEQEDEISYDPTIGQWIAQGATAIDDEPEGFVTSYPCIYAGFYQAALAMVWYPPGPMYDHFHTLYPWWYYNQITAAFHQWTISMWTHYDNWSQGSFMVPNDPSGCGFLENRMILWSFQLAGISNPYHFSVKAAKIQWASAMWYNCNCPGPHPQP